MSDTQSNTVESWRPVVGYEGLYEVSDLGRVRRVNAPNWRTWAGRIIKVMPHASGYSRVTLTRDGKQEAAAIHRLVARAFIGPTPPGHHVNHMDGDRANNRLDNLEIDTIGHNIRHSLWTGARKIMGEDNPLAKLNPDAVRAIRREYRPRTKTGSAIALAARYGVSRSLIGAIVSRQIWRHVAD